MDITFSISTGVLKWTNTNGFSKLSQNFFQGYHICIYFDETLTSAEKQFLSFSLEGSIVGLNQLIRLKMSVVKLLKTASAKNVAKKLNNLAKFRLIKETM